MVRTNMKEKNTEIVYVEPYFKTTDILLVAILLMQGVCIADIEDLYQDKSVFVFEHQEDIGLIVKNYKERRLSLEPRSVLESLRGVKAHLQEYKLTGRF